MKYTVSQLLDKIRSVRQAIVWKWGVRAFGEDHMLSLPQRGLRMVEEAIELSQTCGCDRDQVKALVDHIFDKPPGEIAQEIGGVSVTLLALAHTARLDADTCEAAEIARVLDKPFEHFAARNAAKNAAGFDAGAWPIKKHVNGLAAEAGDAD